MRGARAGGGAAAGQHSAAHRRRSDEELEDDELEDDELELSPSLCRERLLPGIFGGALAGVLLRTLIVSPL